ncbi:MAG TPA: roadblock/LC7 domain-containing protein [Candidatus Methylomirabilis sp.]
MSGIGGSMQRLAHELRGCLGAFAMDYDGLPLEIVRAGAGIELDAIGAEMATILREARQAAQDLGLGPLRGVSVRAVGPTLIFQDSGREYLLVAVLDRASSAVVGRRALAEAARDEPVAP